MATKPNGFVLPGLPPKWATAVFCLGIAAIVGQFVFATLDHLRLKGELKDERAKVTEAHAAAVDTQEKAAQSQVDRSEAEHRAQLGNSAWISGALARERRQKEWALRTAHDPQLAQTVMQTNLLAMEHLGRDATLAAQTALEQVARLAAPPGSRVEIDPEGGGFRVRVAFMMSRLSSQEAGAFTKHHTAASMRAEIQQLSARVLKDLYDFCGSRGIQSITVTCNHTIRQTIMPQAATPEERAVLEARAQPVTSRLYRVSLAQAQAREVVDWRSVQLSRVIQLGTVEYDNLSTLKITRGSTWFEPRRDAEGELEF